MRTWIRTRFSTKRSVTKRMYCVFLLISAKQGAEQDNSQKLKL